MHGALFLSAALMGDSQDEERVGAGPQQGTWGKGREGGVGRSWDLRIQQLRWLMDILKWKVPPPQEVGALCVCMCVYPMLREVVCPWRVWGPL